MFLFEFTQIDPLVTKLVTISDQLKTSLESGEITDSWTVDQLLDYFQSYDVTLDKTDLYNMIQSDPLKNVIDNIQGDDVIFKGQGSESEDNPEQQDNNKDVVNSMAHRALK